MRADSIPIAEDLAIILDAAGEAAEIAMRYFRRDPEVFWKGSSPVTEADYAVDTYLRRTLTDARPDYGWLSEETEDTPERLSSRRTFVVDPIDGTRAFMDGRDVWCIAIAVIEAGRPLVGVLNCPARGEVFSALRGSGARLNDRMLSPSPPQDQRRIGGPDSMVNKLPPGLRAGLEHQPYVPSLAYRIAMVAAGRLDASFVKQNSHDWDLAAADLILQEAGGKICASDGHRLLYGKADTRHQRLAAGRGNLLETMVGVLQAME